jgi:hypothetical protein
LRKALVSGGLSPERRPKRKHPSADRLSPLWPHGDADVTPTPQTPRRGPSPPVKHRTSPSRWPDGSSWQRDRGRPGTWCSERTTVHQRLSSAAEWCGEQSICDMPAPLAPGANACPCSAQASLPSTHKRGRSSQKAEPSRWATDGVLCVSEGRHTTYAKAAFGHLLPGTVPGKGHTVTSSRRRFPRLYRGGGVGRLQTVAAAHRTWSSVPEGRLGGDSWSGRL